MAYNCETLCSPACKKQEKLNKLENNLKLEQQTCATCNTTFSIDHFYVKNKETQARLKHCKYCTQERNQNNLLNNPNRRAENYKYKNQWSRDNPERNRNSYLKRIYGITSVEYEKIAEDQNHNCAICNKKETKQNIFGNPKRLAVDHCHSTGKVRGLLCFHCNSSIGKFKEDIETLENAINYLKKHKED